MEKKQPLIVIAGPTASGKTAAAVETAKIIGGEIISADSMQIYKYMDIGTAKPTIEEMKGVPHYLIDDLYPDEEYSVAVFKDLAKQAVDHIISKGKYPIVCGGTGFYINALLHDNDFDGDAPDWIYRNRLYGLAQKEGNAYLHKLLYTVDPASCEKIHPNNVKRVVRALEFHKNTGQKISDHNSDEKKKDTVFDAKIFVLHMNRAALYTRIEKRVDEMLAKGLVEEVANLLERGYSPELTSMKGLGYKEIIPCLQGAATMEEATAILKRDTRRFAKRQLTWFKNQMQGQWIDVSAVDSPFGIPELIAEKTKNRENNNNA